MIVLNQQIGANGTWFVNGKGGFTHLPPKTEVEDPEAFTEKSQFYPKVMTHENVHVNQNLNDPRYSWVGDSDYFYNETLQYLTAATKPLLELEIFKAVMARVAYESEWCDEHVVEIEKPAFDAQNAVDVTPHFLEYLNDSWIPDYVTKPK